MSMHLVAKPLAYGAASAVVAALLFGVSEPFNFAPLGKYMGSLPSPVVTFGLGAGAALLVEFADGIIIPHIPQSDVWANREALLVNALAGAGAFAALYWVANPSSIEAIGLPVVLGAGAGSSVLGAYLDNFLEGRSGM